MAVADTDVNIFDDTENSGNNGGGGGGTTDVTIFSSRNTITAEEVSPGEWDVNVANEEALRYIIHNFKEFMDAAVDIRDNQYSRGRSCVMQLVKDIDMTSPTATDETTYAGLIDRTNKKYNFGGFFKYTTILCDGTRRTLQLTYPDNGNLDTWTFGAEWVRFTNVAVGGGITSYGSFPNHGSPSVSAVSFSRYLLESTGNLNYALDNCEITCCGMPDNTFNPFIKEGSGDNRNAWGIYHSRYVFDNCLFWHGADPHGGIWATCNAPIVITSNYNSTYERSIRIKQLSKSISNTTAETGVPNFQIRTDNASVPTNSWSSHKWQITADGTALVSCQAGNQYLVLKTRLAVNDLYIQDQSGLQPEGATPTYNWVSLVSLLQNQGRQVIDSQSLEYFIGQITGNNDFVRVDGNIVFSRFFENSNNFIFFDAHGHIDVEKTLYLIPIQGYVQMCGLLYGTNYGESATCQTIYAECGGVGNSILKNSVKGARAQGLRSADIEVIEYNGENYLALEKNWSGGDLFLKGYSNLTQEEIDEDLILLYYDGTRQKWYSDSDLTQEVSFTVLETSGRFPATLDFGGTSSQVVAGDGGLLNWGDKLGYWKGETANLPPVGSREPNMLYITTDY